MKKRKGSTLIIVIMVFAVFSILGTGILNLTLNNTKQAKIHENKIQAYYVARSGAEIAEAAIINMNSKEIEKLENEVETQLQIDQIKFENGELKSLLVKRENNNLTIISKAKVGNSYETVEKVMLKIDPGSEETGGYRGVIKEYDTIDYLGNLPEVTDCGGYKLIDGERYEIIKGDVGDIADIKSGNNYYIEGKLDIKLQKKFKLNSNLYVKNKISIELEGNNKNIEILDSMIVSEKKIYISNRSGHIEIENSTILAKDKIEIEADDGEIKIDKSVIKSSKGIDLKAEEYIEINDSTIVAKDKIEIVDADKGVIKNSAIRSSDKIDLIAEEYIEINDSTIVAEKKIKIEDDDGAIKNSVIKSSKKIEIEEDIVKNGSTISEYTPKDDLVNPSDPGMPNIEDSSNIGGNNSYESYYK